MAAITAGARARTALTADTALGAAEVLEIVKEVAEEVGTTGRGWHDGQFVKSEVRPRVIEEGAGRMRLGIGTGWEGWENAKATAVFSTVTGTAADGRTTLRVGGLERYRIMQSKFLGLIPSGPAMIFHYGSYKRYLGEVKAELEARDATATVLIGVPEP